MFEKYIYEQPIAVKILTNALENNKLSHAYIFETNNYEKSYELVIEFIKNIECLDRKLEVHDEDNCNICSAINSNNYIELKIINSDALQIKKEEMLNLQKEFNSKVIEGNKKIYLIKNAERLNDSSSNTILKFLEEPEENIIAILMTPSRHNLLKTIISRCQIISLNENNKEKTNIIKKIYNTFCFGQVYEEVEEKIKLIVNNTISFVNFYETRNKEALLFTNEIYFKNFTTKEDFIISFEIIKLLYYDILKYKINNKFIYFKDYEDKLSNIIKNNNDNYKLSYKLELTIKAIEKIKYNINLNLLIDKFLMEIGGV